jgi:hypothetical protein
MRSQPNHEMADFYNSSQISLRQYLPRRRLYELLLLDLFITLQLNIK